MQNNWLFSSFFLILPFLLFSQEDTISHTLQVVDVSANTIRTSKIGSQTQTWNHGTLAQLPAQNIADLLESESGVFIKSYGLGSLATSSIRGGSASHTLVLWNGVPIQSPMLGQLDLALLPTSFVEDINLEYGGASAMWGSGAVGGVIALENQPTFKEGVAWNRQNTIGSFGYYQEQAQISVGNSRFQSKSKIGYLQAENNFFYEIHSDFPKREQKNAAQQQWNLLQDFYYKIGDRQQIAAHIWYQRSNRQLPPTNAQNQSAAYQQDKALRAVVNWKHVGNKTVWNGKAGYFKEELDFQDSLSRISSLSYFNTLLGEIDVQYALNDNHKFSLGTTHIYTKAVTDGYDAENQPTEYKAALFASYQVSLRRGQLQLSVREEIVNNKFLPIVPILSIDKTLFRNFMLQMKVSKNYRLPTFNDRFWQPGGNPDLLPESGWSQEMTLSNSFQKNQWRFKTSLTGFNRTIQNWIFWSIREGQQFWSANNITKVWSRGLEGRLRADFTMNQVNYYFFGGYHFTRSTNQVALQRPNIPMGQQLFYTPIHQIYTTIGIRWKDFSTAYQHRVTSTSIGINEAIEAYDLGQFRIQYKTDFEQFSTNFSLQVHNIWNASYFVIERRPMAGRYFRIGIAISRS